MVEEPETSHHEEPVCSAVRQVAAYRQLIVNLDFPMYKCWGRPEHVMHDA